MVEDGLDDTTEELFIATEPLDLVACHADDGALHLWRRIEHVGLDGEEVCHVVPCLYEHGEHAILLCPGLRGHAQGHLALYHARAAGDEVAVVEHLEENLRRDVVGVIAREHEGLPAEDLREVHAQEVAFDERSLPYCPRGGLYTG